MTSPVNPNELVTPAFSLWVTSEKTEENKEEDLCEMSVICRLNLSFVAMLVTALFVYLMFALMDDSWLIQKHSAPGPELGYLKSSNMSVEGKGRLEDKVNIGEHSHTNRETKENTERIGYTGWMSPEEFILQRDKPPNQTESTCTGCELKANCYTTKCKYHIQSLFTNCMTKCTLSNIVHPTICSQFLAPKQMSWDQEI